MSDKLVKVNKNDNFMKFLRTVCILFLISLPAKAYNYSGLGVIDGTNFATLIVSSGNWGDDIVFGAGYNTPTYQGFYTQSNLQQYYSTPISSPANFVNSTDAGVQTSSRPYSVYNLVVQGAGTYVFQISDHNHTLNQVGSPTVDLMAALYVTSGNATTAFVPSNTLTNLVAVSDDNSATGSSNPYALFYQNASATDCVTLSLVYFPWSSAPSGQLVDITASGPGQIASSCSALGPSTADTLTSMTPNAFALRGAFSLQSAIINTGLNYDCTTFDSNGICLSAGGRVTDTVNPATNSQGALVIASYRANDNWRIGGYLDQNISTNDARGVNLDNSNPMGGVFAVWNQNTDGTGYQVRVAAGYSDKDVTISRSVVGTAEAGTGDSSLRTQAYSATISRGFQINDTRWIASPYLGVRYTRIKRAGYTEDATADVQNPLTYSALSQETTTALAGVRFNGQFGDKLNVLASAGVESDIAHNTGDYAATGVNGLTPIAFNQNIRHVRPVAQAGVRYAIDKRQTVGANLNYRQEAFNSTHSVMGMVNYEIGF